MTPTGGTWASSASDGAMLIYSIEGAAVVLNRPVAGRTMRWIAEGVVVEVAMQTGETQLVPPSALAGRPLALWIAPVP